MNIRFTAIVLLFTFMLQACEKVPIAAFSTQPQINWNTRPGDVIVVTNESVNAYNPRIYYQNRLVGTENATIIIEEGFFTTHEIRLVVESESNEYRDEEVLEFTAF